MKVNGDSQKFFNGAMVGIMIAVIIAIIGSISTIRYIYAMQKDLQTWFEKDLVGQNSIQIARANLLNLDRDLKLLLLTGGAGENRAIMKKIRKHRDNFVSQMTTARPLFNSKKGADEVEIAYRLSREYLKKLEEVLARDRTDRHRALSRSNADMSALFEELDRVLDKLDDIKQEKDIQVFRNIISQNEVTMGISFIVLVITLIFRFSQLSSIRKKRKRAR